MATKFHFVRKMPQQKTISIYCQASVNQSCIYCYWEHQ